MKKILNLFRLRRGEFVPGLVALVYAVALNALVVAKYFDLFSETGHGRWSIFIKNFTISGFDPITYTVLTAWDPSYNVYRHPFLAFMVWPLSVLNGWLVDLVGLNLAQVITACALVFCTFYAFIFLLRTLTDVVRAPRFESIVLSMMLFSFAYVMISASVPDHFCPSLFLLMLTIYIAGMKMRGGRRFTIVQTWVLFLLTAGVTLSNGVKTFIYALFTNGRRFFRPKYLLLAVILPCAFIWIFARWEYRTYVLPGEKARHEAKVKKSKQKRQKDFAAFMDTTSIKDSAQAAEAFSVMMKQKAIEKYRADHRQPWNQHTGKPISKGEFMRWTDVTTSRLETAVENLFGESLQLHRDHLLEDTLRSRPVVVEYRWALSYVVEGLVVALFLLGVWCGRRSRFLWMVLLGFAFDMALHMGLGFGINEVYIMTAHWAFALPVAMAYIAARDMGKSLRCVLRCVLTVLTLYLFLYNFIIYTGYLLC